MVGEIDMCFSLAWLAQLLIWIIVICGVIALLRLLIAFVLPKLGVGGEILAFVAQAFWIIFWVVICCALVFFVFDLIACLGPSLHVPSMR